MSETPVPGIALRNVSKSMGGRLILDDLSLSVARREFAVVLGPSGCGKSTILRLIAGLDTPTAGQVLIDGEDMIAQAPSERGCAMVFQNYALYPHMTVERNIDYSLRVRGRSRAERNARVALVADTLGLTAVLDRKPGTLSGGQQQRVAMARAMIREPRIFLFDEPMSSLDARLRTQLRQDLHRLHRRLEATSLLVTHDQVEAMTLADRLIVMDQGRIRQIGTPSEIYERPADRFVAGFVGTPAMNFISATAVFDALRLPCGVVLPPVPGLPCGPVILGIRPESIGLTQETAADGLQARVDLVEDHGPTRIVHLRVQDLRLTATTDLRPHDGDHLTVRLPQRRFNLFDAATGIRLTF